ARARQHHQPLALDGDVAQRRFEGMIETLHQRSHRVARLAHAHQHLAAREAVEEQDGFRRLVRFQHQDARLPRGLRKHAEIVGIERADPGALESLFQDRDRDVIQPGRAAALQSHAQDDAGRRGLLQRLVLVSDEILAGEIEALARQIVRRFDSDRASALNEFKEILARKGPANKGLAGKVLQQLNRDARYDVVSALGAAVNLDPKTHEQVVTEIARALAKSGRPDEAEAWLA